MSTNNAKPLQRAFPWRETLLGALRQDPRVKLACATANISRNSAYTHYRRYPRFRSEWEHALDQGRDAAYRQHLRRLSHRSPIPADTGTLTFGLRKRGQTFPDVEESRRLDSRRRENGSIQGPTTQDARRMES